MKHIEEVYDLLDRIRRSGLLPVPKGGIRDEDLFGGIDKDELIIELHPADLLIRKDMPIKIRFLDIQEGKLPWGGFALECSPFAGNGHLFSLPE
jgi:hypothetical protein